MGISNFHNVVLYSLSTTVTRMAGSKDRVISLLSNMVTAAQLPGVHSFRNTLCMWFCISMSNFNSFLKNGSVSQGKCF